MKIVFVCVAILLLITTAETISTIEAPANITIESIQNVAAQLRASDSDCALFEEDLYFQDTREYSGCSGANGGRTIIVISQESQNYFATLCRGNAVWLRDTGEVCGCLPNGTELCTPLQADAANTETTSTIEAPANITIESLQNIANQLKARNLDCIMFSVRFDFNDRARCSSGCGCGNTGRYVSMYRDRTPPLPNECLGSAIWLRDDNSACGCSDGNVLCTSE